MGFNPKMLAHAIVYLGQQYWLTIFAGNQTKTVWHFRFSGVTDWIAQSVRLTKKD